MNKEIANIIADIQRVSILINLETKHDSFIYDSGHINQISVKIYLNGWEYNGTPYLSDEIYYDVEDCMKDLKRVRDTMRKMYKNGKVNRENFSYTTKTIKHYKFGNYGRDE